MDANTLTLYLVAGGLSISLSLMLLVFAHFQPGTQVMKTCAVAILMLSVGFTLSGFGPELPRWVTVVGTNMLLIAAGAVLYSGFAAFCQQRPVTPDWFGWGVVALTAVPFAYWGLVVPDGHYRAAVFSFAAAAINVRTAMVLVRATWLHPRNLPVWALAVLFGVFSAWMATRGVLSLTATPPPASLRGANPTSWTTVFWYIILVLMMAACVIWMELSRPGATPYSASHRVNSVFDVIEFFRHKLRLLWGVVLILILGIVSEGAVFYVRSFEAEEARLTRSAELANDAFVRHTVQVFSHIDMLLRSVRSFYLRTASLPETDAFIDALLFDKSTIDNVYLITAQGNVAISHDPQAVGRSVADRDYFLHLKSTPGDQLYIASVEIGRVTGKFHFRVVRRVEQADGSFAGVILATVSPESFSRYYHELATGSQNITSLLGINDKKLRARAPEPPDDRWQTPVESQLWQELASRPTGHYKSTSTVDGIHRTFAFKKVGQLPLVMVTGFSDADLQTSVHEGVRWLALGALVVLLTVLLLTALLTVEIWRRNEQDRFLSMLSHELKTPLSVLRMALGVHGPLSATTHGHAQQSVQDMDAIVERCLQVDRLQNHRHNVTLQTCHLGELLSEIQTASLTPDRLMLDLAELPTFTADTQLLRIALSNLVDNALKYAAPGSPVQVSARRQSHQSQPGILVEVVNAPGSAGLPEPRKVFKKYYRSPGAHSKSGSGLGLYLVKTVVKRLDGWVRYVPASDTVRFQLWLPV